MDMPSFVSFSCVAAGAALLGSAIVLRAHEWSHRNSIVLVSFATGVMLAIAFGHLLPEAYELSSRAPLATFGGFLFLYLLQAMIRFHHCHDDQCDQRRGILPAAGLSFHSLLDGMMIAIGAEAGGALGTLTALAVILHKMPDGITISGIMIHAGLSRRRIIAVSALVALLTPVGALTAHLFLRGVAPEALGILLAITAGSFIYLAAADLLPETHRHRRHAVTAAFLAGAAIVVIAGQFLH